MTLYACQRDAYRRDGTAEVLSCRAREDDTFAVELVDSIFYPEGGGQPADRGRLGDAPVLDVRRAEEPGRVVAITTAGVPAGPVQERVDWERRYDHMQQHTAQHLITALADDRLGYATTRFHLGESYCSIDLDCTSIERDELAQLADWCNEEIRRARPVEWRAVEPDTYRKMDVRSRGLPEGHTGEVRLVEIEGIDLNTCGGTHVSSTAELQTIVFVGDEIHRDRVRLSWLAGGRVRRAFERMRAREDELVEKLSAGPGEHVDLVAGLQEDLQTAERRERHLGAELAEHLGARLAASDDELRTLHRRETDMTFFHAIADACLERDPEATVLLTGGGDHGEGVFLVAGPEPDEVRALGGRVLEALEGRGGGPPGRFQGKVERIQDRHRIPLVGDE